jgi:YVTN family beta-propeller protein
MRSKPCSLHLNVRQSLEQKSEGLNLAVARMENPRKSVTRFQIARFASQVSRGLLFLFCGNILIASNAQLGKADVSIPVGLRPDRLVISSDDSEVYVTNEGDNTVAVIDTTNNNVSAIIHVGKRPGPMAIASDNRLFVGNRGGFEYSEGSARFVEGSVSVIDTMTKQVISTIPMGDEISDLAVTPDGKKLYLAIVRRGLQKVMTATYAVIPVSAVTCPMALVVTPDGKRVYVNYQCAPKPGSVGHDPIMVYDTQVDDAEPGSEVPLAIITGWPKTAIRIANVGGPLAIAPDGSKVWAVGTDACARRLNTYDFEGCPELDPTDATADYTARGIINIIDTHTNNLFRRLQFLGYDVSDQNNPIGAAYYPTFFPDGKQVAVTTGGAILIFDAENLNQVGRMSGKGYTSNLAFTRDGDRAYVAVRDENRIQELQIVAKAARVDATTITHEGNSLKPGPNAFMLTFESSIPDKIAVGSSISINDVDYEIATIAAPSKSISILGKGNGLLSGVNSLKIFGQTLTYWYESNRLRSLPGSYFRPESSYAIIAAIDDYDRKRDAKRRGPTGYEELSHMVENAQQLRQVLLMLGFPPNHIQTFYDENATAENLDHALKNFWKGGQFEGARRVVFYFAGHGDEEQGNGYLVTYDFDPRRPTASSLLMSSLSSQHFPLINAHHFLAAIDSCSSGLAVPSMRVLGGQRLEGFDTLAQIGAAVDERPRNLIVAGTGKERALAPSGGIFTRALIDGLKGGADYSQNGIIQFQLLAFYVQKQVVTQAKELGVNQKPNYYKATAFGDGEMLFQLPNRKASLEK